MQNEMRNEVCRQRREGGPELLELDSASGGMKGEREAASEGKHKIRRRRDRGDAEEGSWEKCFKEHEECDL